MTAVATDASTQPQGEANTNNVDVEEEQRSHNHAKRSDALKAIVDAWLQPTDKGESKGVGETADTVALTESELSLMSKLKPMEVPFYDKITGCISHAAYRRNCYPSAKAIPSMITFHPGEVVVEYGAFLGEATFALGSAIEAAQAKYGNVSTTRILAMDTWKEHQAFAGLWSLPSTYQPPKEVAGLETTAPPAYYQFLTNIRVRKALAERVVPLSMLVNDMVARGNALGLSAQRPRLIYVNPPRHAASLNHDLPALWRLLACGGTIGGAGYPSSRAEIDTFAASVPGAKLQAYYVHAPGSKFERHEPYADPSTFGGGKYHANFTFWKIQNKMCS